MCVSVKNSYNEFCKEKMVKDPMRAHTVHTRQMQRGEKKSGHSDRSRRRQRIAHMSRAADSLTCHLLGKWMYVSTLFLK